MKKLIVVLLLTCIVGIGGAAAIYWWTHKPVKTAPSAPQPAVKMMPVPLKSQAAAVPEPAVTSGYVIGILSVSKSINGQEIGVQVTNDSDKPLVLQADQQFKLVGLTSHDERAPLTAKTSPSLKTTIAPNKDISGKIVFDAFNQEQSELRFYPDVTQPTYIVVPLIPLPEAP